MHYYVIYILLSVSYILEVLARKSKYLSYSHQSFQFTEFTLFCALQYRSICFVHYNTVQFDWILPKSKTLRNVCNYIATDRLIGSKSLQIMYFSTINDSNKTTVLIIWKGVTELFILSKTNFLFYILLYTMLVFRNVLWTNGTINSLMNL